MRTHWPLIDLNQYLHHTGQLVTTTLDINGDVVVSSITTINCLVYDGHLERVVAGDEMVEIRTYSAVLPSSIFADVGWQLNSVRDTATGDLIFAGGRIIHNEVYSHRDFGPQAREVKLNCY